MKTETKERITNENTRITESNVQHIGECITMSAIKKMMRFAHHPKSLDKLYAGLVEDIYGNRGYNTTFSHGYDLASEVICFLCHYIGHNLDDLACQNRKGELLTVRFACYRHALRYETASKRCVTAKAGSISAYGSGLRTAIACTSTGYSTFLQTVWWAS